MGWVSYLEDIVERLTEDFENVRREVMSDAPVASRKDVLLDWLVSAERTLRELRRNLDLATDPDVNLAAEVFQLEATRRELQLEIQPLRVYKLQLEELKREHGALQLEIQSLRVYKEQLEELKREHDELARALKEEHHKYKRIQKTLEQAMDESPEAIYNRHSSPDRIRRIRKDDDD